MTRSIQQLAIAGLNVYSLLSALAFRQAFPDNEFRISIVGTAKKIDEKTDKNTDNCIYLAQNNIALLSKFGIDSVQLFNELKATYVLNRKFKGWGNTDFSIPCHCELDFFHQPTLLEVSQLRRQGYQLDFTAEQFFFSNKLVDAGLAPVAKNFPFNIDYQWLTLHSNLYPVLLNIALNNNITITAENIIDVTLNSQQQITHLVTENATITADFFIDITGDKHSLITQFANFSSKKLPTIRHNNGKLTAKTNAKEANNIANNIASEVTVEAIENGYVVITPSAECSLIHYFFSTEHISAKQATAVLTSYLEKQHVTLLSPMVFSSHNNDIGSHAWLNNCVALANSFTTTEPLSAANDGLFAKMLHQVIKQINNNKLSSADINQFNNQALLAAAEINAFNNALYLFNNKRDSAYWQTPKEQSLTPQAILPIIQQWFTGADITVNTNNTFSMFEQYTWYCLFTGLALYPPANKVHPNVANITLKFTEIQSLIDGCAVNFPTLNEHKQSEQASNVDAGVK